MVSGIHYDTEYLFKVKGDKGKHSVYIEAILMVLIF